MAHRILRLDPGLLPFGKDIRQRMANYENKRKELLSNGKTLCDFANGHEYFGFHKTADGWYYREWAPAAEEVYLTGDMVDWRWLDLRLTPIGNGVFEIFLNGPDFLYNGCRVKTIIRHGGELLERIPLYIKRVEQDPSDYSWCGVIVDEPEFKWSKKKFVPSREL